MGTGSTIVPLEQLRAALSAEKSRADALANDLASAHLISCPACDGECQCTALAMAEHRRDWKERCDRIAAERDRKESELNLATRAFASMRRESEALRTAESSALNAVRQYVEAMPECSQRVMLRLLDDLIPPAAAPAAEDTPECMRRMTPEELAKVPPLTKEQMRAALEQGMHEREAMDAEHVRCGGSMQFAEWPNKESAAESAAEERQVIPVPVKEPFFLVRCADCGYCSSSEQWRTVSYGDDADILCPRCGSSRNDEPWRIAPSAEPVCTRCGKVEDSPEHHDGVHGPASAHGFQLAASQDEVATFGTFGHGEQPITPAGELLRGIGLVESLQSRVAPMQLLLYALREAHLQCVRCGYDLDNPHWSEFPELATCPCAPIRAALALPTTSKPSHPSMGKPGGGDVG
jgi:hypothetical protein